MSKTILLIENDAPFAKEMSGALEAMGFRVRVTGDGKDGLELARDLAPDAIVLCVELPKLSGYSICNRLKKDDALRRIPLILTSSEATEEVFEDHKKLKVRAEDYLIKPYVSATLLEKLAALIGMPERAATPEPPGAPAPVVEAAGVEEEVVNLEEELGLELFAGEPGEDLSTLDLDSLPDEPATAAPGGANLDADLKLLDDAFDGLSASVITEEPRRSAEPATPGALIPDLDAKAADEAIEKAMGVDRPVTSEDLEAASASLSDGDETGAPADLGGLGDEAELALESLGEAPPSPTLAAFDALDILDEPSAVPASPVVSAAAASAGAVVSEVAAAAAGLTAGAASLVPATGAGELARLEAELSERRAALNAREVALRELKARLDEAESALGEKEAEAASLKARGDTLAAQAKKAETDARASREDARRSTELARAAEARAEGAEGRASSAEARISAADGRCRAAEQEAASQRRAAEQAAAALAAKSAELAAAQASAARLGALERDVERLEADLVVARGEVAGARSEAERHSADLKRRISELEAANAKNEERVVKAYLKIKGDEKVRDKARKALSIALQLLEEGLPAEPSGEKRPRPVPE